MKNPVIPAQSTTKKKMQKTYVDKKKGKETKQVESTNQKISFLTFFFFFLLVLFNFKKNVERRTIQ